MNIGLSVPFRDFEKLPTRRQLSILYENTEQLKEMVSSYKLNQKIQYFWLLGLTITFISILGFKDILPFFIG